MPAGHLSPRPLGSSGMDVSPLSLGSWRTFEHLPAETGVAILRAAREEGISFFDDARYDDETGRAPIPTGYSEVLFGELFRGAGVRRDEVVANSPAWPGTWARPRLRWRWRSPSPIRTSPACCSAPPAPSSSGPTAP
jgi:aryl-alcohol dehydrogenase-like predicted oxidoreductase